MPVEFAVIYLRYTFVKYFGDTRIYVRELGNKSFQNINEAVFRVQEIERRFRRKRLNRKKRNKAKLLSREWSRILGE